MSDMLTIDVQGPVAWLTLDRPDKLNALHGGFWDGMPGAVARLEENPAVRVLVIRGAGRGFTAGLDVMSMMPRLPIDPASAHDGAVKAKLHALIRGMQRAITCVERARFPVIAAMHGPSIGAGVDLATACDLRLCAADTTFSVREVRIGMVADVGTLQRLPAIVGQGLARELAFTGRDFGAEEALRIGLVNRVLPDPEQLFEAAGALAAEIAALPPLAVQGTKAVMVEATRHEIDRNLEYVATWNTGHLINQDLMRAVGAMRSPEPPTYEGT